MAQVDWTIDTSTKTVQIFTEDLGAGVTLDMVLIPPGEFLMGSPEDELERRENEGPQHLVTIARPFFMAQYLITQEQWRSVVAMPQIQRKLKFNPSRFDGENLPIEGTSWQDAEEFCLRLSNYTDRQYRLPTEAEWEYACRAGSTTAFHFGETINPELANCNGRYTYNHGEKSQYRQRTTIVGSFLANDFGLYDMHGNLWEWCLDDWHNNYQGAPHDGSPWISSNRNIDRTKILRGGSWINFPRLCRSACRRNDHIGYLDYNRGFRVVYSSARTLL
jgi:formylglycine-generating enzyme required for sulfatase activity